MRIEGANALRWLQDNYYYFILMDYVGTSVHGDIKKAFDAMVIELKRLYDKKRYTHTWTPSYMAKCNCNDVHLLCRRFAQDNKFVLGAMAIKWSKKKKKLWSRSGSEEPTPVPRHIFPQLWSLPKKYTLSTYTVHDMYSFLSCFRRWLLSLFHSQREERLPRKPSSLFLLFRRPLECLCQLLPQGYDYLNYSRNILITP